jgi:hypothetical protein
LPDAAPSTKRSFALYVPDISSENPKIESSRTVSRGGTVYQQNTSNIGHREPNALTVGKRQ